MNNNFFLSCVVVTVFFAFTFVLWGGDVLATDFTSSNFISRDPVIDDFGGFSSGTDSFQQLNAGGQTVIGESTSTNFIWRAGFLYFTDFTLVQQNWRWYTDETSETPTSSLAAENTAPTSVQNNDTLKLRMTIAELAGISSPSQKFRLQFSTQADFSSDVNNVVESGSCGASSLWCYGDGVDDDGDSISTTVLSDSDTTGTHNESGISTSDFTHPFSSAVEYEFTVLPSNPEPQTVYYFRAFNNTASQAVGLDSGASYPSIAAVAASLSFQVFGVSSGTGTEGITTDIATTPTTIAYGSLAADTETEAAQTLQVNTNAPDGYTVYVFEDGPLQSEYGEDIADVAGTNASPAAWGIAAGETSAFGYHTGDEELGTGTTSRFSADDTYAALTSTASEIAYNAGPVIDEETDIIYKIEADSLHPAGVYETSLEYIVVPIF